MDYKIFLDTNIIVDLLMERHYELDAINEIFILAGKEKVESADAYKLKLVNKDGKEFTYFVDAATYYILKVVTNETINGQNVTGTTTYSDYKKTDSGFVMPYTSIANQGFEITNKVSKVEFNKEIDAKIFEMPK